MHAVTIRILELADYEPTWHAMQDLTQARDSQTQDEIWLLQHPPVFTQGQAGKAEHLIATGDIPVVQVDRGGQVTYHGPGQLVGYLMIDLKRKKMGARDLVTAIEKAIVATLEELDIEAAPRADAPGVYTQEKKIASLGLRIRNGCSFHGLSLNINMDLSPFLRINPCGYAGMEMAQVNDFIANPDFDHIQQQLLQQLLEKLSYNQHSVTHEPWTSTHG
ncbi:MAG: lipoyl(octanoyl) transferase LipB [Pseudomonadales bacterium]|nr:lipoyl(octanoyl) transferase LipB [Pseudomonadales bacterium]